MGDAAMVKITCDYCRAEKESGGTGAEWILGYDLLIEAPPAVRRVIRFWDHWDNNHVL
jgi:hypothetical protein